VPLTAQHADAGVLDATVDPLGEDMPWEAIHRARPRAPLTCRECGHRLHAKLSPKGLRFFAHDRAAPDCEKSGWGSTTAGTIVYRGKTYYARVYPARVSLPCGG